MSITINTLKRTTAEPTRAIKANTLPATSLHPAALAASLLAILGCAAEARDASPARLIAQSAAPAASPSGAPAPSTVVGNGVTLRSVSVDFPDPGRMFPGGDQANAINNNCLACHSAGMVLTQPNLSRAAWQNEVDKMRKTYKAPIAEADAPAIVDYLAGLNKGQ